MSPQANKTPLSIRTFPNALQLVKAYEEQLDAKQKEVLAFQKKYNIRIKVGDVASSEKGHGLR